ncbi:MAG: hypothetical protein WAV27_11540 [Xanthobacteraceae bacterium]
MMIWETVVMTHLTAKEGLFVIPQFDIGWDKLTGTGGSCPDFIALHPDIPERVYIVEVSEGWDLGALDMRFVERKTRWYQPLNKSFLFWGQAGPFDFRSIAYIRRDAAYFTCEGQDIEKRYLEDEQIAFHWKS